MRQKHPTSEAKVWERCRAAAPCFAPSARPARNANKQRFWLKVSPLPATSRARRLAPSNEARVSLTPAAQFQTRVTWQSSRAGTESHPDAESQHRRGRGTCCRFPRDELPLLSRYATEHAAAGLLVEDGWKLKKPSWTP